MNTLKRFFCAALCCAFFSTNLYAHGGESHAEPAAKTAAASARLAVTGEVFEAVVLRDAQGLQLWLDDADTTAAISRATVQLDIAGQVRDARETTPGVYRVDGNFDPHALALVITISAGENVDVLNGVLPEAPHDDEAAPDDNAEEAEHAPWWQYAGVAAIALGALLGGFALGRRRTRSGSAALVLLGGLALMPVVDVRAHGGDTHVAPVAMGDQPARTADGQFFLPKATQRLAGLRTRRAELSDHPQVWVWPAQVVSDAESTQSLHAPQHAHVTGTLPRPGQVVKKGETLFRLRAVLTTAERQQLTAQFARVGSQLNALSARLNRLEGLEALLSQRELETLQAEKSALKAEHEAISNSLRGEIDLRAEQDGIIVSVGVKSGDTVDDDQVLAVLRHRDRIAVRALAPLDTLPDLERATFVWSGGRLPLLWHATELVRESQQLPVLFRNVEAGVIPALAALGEVQAVSKHGLRGVRVPASALRRGPQGETLAFVKTAPETFAARTVKTSPGAEGDQVITEGLDADARVVVDGLSALDALR